MSRSRSRTEWPGAVGAVVVMCGGLALGFGLSKGQDEGGSGGGEDPGAPPPAERADPPPAEEGVGAIRRGVEQEELAVWTFAVEPKPLSQRVTRGLDWLVEHQLPSGGWGQGEESAQMGDAMAHLADAADVADTCMAALALVRSGALEAEGPRRTALARGVAYVCGQIEESDADSLFVSSVRGTRVQAKIGTYVDTFLASMLLSEVKGRMPEPAANLRVDGALAKVLSKIERNQRADGGFEGTGWAPVLAQSMAGKGINRAAQAGAELPASVNFQNAEFFVALAEAPATEPAGGPVAGEVARMGYVSADAGVPLYSLACNLAGLSDFVNTGAKRERDLDAILASSKDEAERSAARDEKDAIARARESQGKAQAAIVGRLEDPGFVAGFGSNGGEEFLSYMNVSESLVVEGGDVWQRWDRAVTDNLNRVQNEDGSWTGHHCITGRTFVTSAALLTLMADRTPVPVAALAAAEPAEERPAVALEAK